MNREGEPLLRGFVRCVPPVGECHLVRGLYGEAYGEVRLECYAPLVGESSGWGVLRLCSLLRSPEPEENGVIAQEAAEELALDDRGEVPWGESNPPADWFGVGPAPLWVVEGEHCPRV